MAELEPKKPSGQHLPPGLPEVHRAPENLVAEIVDQITEKQTRAARQTRARPDWNPGCSPCPEEIVAGTPYQAVLSCAAGEPGSS
jgi:hypothetical protein